MDDSKLIIIGDGDENLKQMVVEAQMATNNRIEYLGVKNNVYDYMALVDAFILVSRYEGLPIVAIEALQVGLPVISTPVGGLPDVIENNQNGFLSHSQSVKNILNAIDKFKTCSSEKLIVISKSNKEKYINLYSIEVCATKHLRLYQLPH
jgi:glycosyltransferase involved in cell wall biosynthesis